MMTFYVCNKEVNMYDSYNLVTFLLFFAHIECDLCY